MGTEPSRCRDLQVAHLTLAKGRRFAEGLLGSLVKDEMMVARSFAFTRLTGNVRRWHASITEGMCLRAG